MARVILPSKSCAENPLKSSTPLGAALAFLGVEGAVPLFHGSQGCTSFALVLAVRHFKEAIPLQTTAMNEPATVLGGADNLEEALVNIATRMKPKFIGVASTALVETRGEDFAGELKNIVAKRRELDDSKIVFASTPDFEGALEDGWARATKAIIEALVTPRAFEGAPPRVLNVLPGVHETPGAIAELSEIIEAFGLTARFLPDVSSSLDGHVPDAYVGTSLGGTPLGEVKDMARAVHVLALGEHMRGPAETLSQKIDVPFTVLPTLIGLEASDKLIALLSQLSGKSVPARFKQQRSQLIDAMLDAHFHLSGKRIAVAADPDLLCALVELLSKLGAEVVVAVSSTKNSPNLASLPCESVHVGDLGDLEELARAQRAELLVTHSHGRQAAEALGLPLFRIGFPIFDRLGHQHRLLAGYRGTRELIYEIANLFMGQLHEHKPEDFPDAIPPAPILEDSRHVDA
ncbi:MAG TPA: nitrogenase iron-molybdenum cofactor biosynthesis protein NifN [Polyangiaceae bacterium]|nr:nitrogenase iron-molybdenum cofactor biosynthesis protein NifN [Polyangiaceae bacterium]